MRNPELKIKIKSLAAEAAIIRKDENKYKVKSKHPLLTGPLRDGTFLTEDQLYALNLRKEKARAAWLSLKDHRRSVVRPEARSALIAYGYLSGFDFNRIELKHYEEPSYTRIAQMLISFKPDILATFNDKDRNTRIAHLAKILREWHDESYSQKEAAQA